MNVPPDSIERVLIGMRLTGGNVTQLFWGTSEESGFTEAKSARLAPETDGRFHLYVPDLAAHDEWAGKTITNLRIDPTNAAGASFEIAFIVGGTGDDQDGDGFPDETEGPGDANGNGVPDVLDPDPDSDGDGIRDGIEDLHGTNPYDANDFPPPLPSSGWWAWAVLAAALVALAVSFVRGRRRMRVQ